MTVIGSAFVLVRPQTSGFQKEAEAGILAPVQDIAKKIGVMLGAAFVAKKSFDFFKGAVGIASDLNEQLQKSGQVFGASEKSVVSFTDTSVEKLGLTQAAALGAAGTFGNLFRTIGLTSDVSAKYSTTLVQLATDLASFSNTSVPDALQAIQAGLVGQIEPLRRYGVELSETAIRQEAVSLGLKVGSGILDSATRTQAAYALILAQTTIAQGDFARTQGGFANQQRIVAARFGEVEQRVGQGLLPAMIALAGVTNRVLLPALESTFQVVGTLLSPLGALADHAAGLRQVVIVLAAAFSAVLVPVLLRFVAVTLAAMAVRIFWFLANLAASATEAAVGLGLVTEATVGARAALTGLGATVGLIGVALGALAFLYLKLNESVVKFKATLAKQGDETAAQQVNRLAATLAALKKRYDDLSFFSFSRPRLQEEIDATTSALKKAQAAAAVEAAAQKDAAFATAFQAKAADEATPALAKLAAANLVLADGTKAVTERAQAWKDALDAVIGSQTKGLRTQIAYLDATDKVTDALTTSVAETRATEDAQSRAADASRNLADKQRALSVLLHTSVVDMKAVKDASRSYRDAILSLADARRTQAEAEQRVIDLLHPSARTQQDAALAVAEANDQQKRSQVAIRAAEENLTATRAKAGVTADEITLAELDLADAKRAAFKATEGQQDATKALADLTPQAIRASKEYTDAQLALSDANRGVTDALTAAQDAGSALAVAERGDINRADEIAAARRDVAAATLEQKRAGEDLRTQLDSLQVSYDITTVKGRALQGALADAADAAVALSSSLLDQTNDFGLAQLPITAYRDGLDAALRKAGATEAQIERLNHQLGLTPKDVNTIVSVELRGLETVVTGLNRIAVVVSSITGTRFITEGVTRFGTNAEGGIYDREQITRISEGNKPEVVLPLTDPARMRQLIAQAGIGDLFAGGSRSTFSSGGFATVNRPAGGVTLVVQPGAIVFYGAPSEMEARAAAGAFIDTVQAKLAARRVDAIVRNA